MIDTKKMRRDQINPTLRDYLPIPAGEIDEAPINVEPSSKSRDEILKSIAKRRGISVEEVIASLPKL
ncbi:hypothetical protein ACNAN0_03850 [Agrilactobacillus fermenti]|uniref:hypothetical protein n=1 Tax=Agrilactobacillus fermenti TaxID=2586909 RepID=UPI003A5C42C1